MTPVKSTFSQQHIHEMEQGNQTVQPTQEISSIVTVQGMVALTLLITAVIQTIKGNLSLYHAYLFINLLFLMSTSFLYFLFSRTSCFHIYIQVWQMVTQQTLLSVDDRPISSPWYYWQSSPSMWVWTRGRSALSQNAITQSKSSGFPAQ